MLDAVVDDMDYSCFLNGLQLSGSNVVHFGMSILPNCSVVRSNVQKVQEPFEN